MYLRNTKKLYFGFDIIINKRLFNVEDMFIFFFFVICPNVRN